MVAKDSASSYGGVGSSSGGIRMMDKRIYCVANGSRSAAVGNGDADFPKRRKCGMNSEPMLAQLEKLASQTASQAEDKMLEEIVDICFKKNSCEQVCDPKIVHLALLNDTDNFHQLWRSTLQSLSESFGPDQGGMSWIEGYIKDALCSDAQTDCVNHSYMERGTWHSSPFRELRTRNYRELEPDR